MKAKITFLFVFCFSLSAWAGEIWSNRQQVDLQTRMQSTVSADTLPGIAEIRYNQFPEGLLSRFQLLEGNAQILNGGLGDGVIGPMEYSYFCGGRDEVDALNDLLGMERLFNPNIGEGNEGLYDIVRPENICRLEGGCGTIVPDGRSFVIGFPKFKSNCRLYKKGYYDNEALTTANPGNYSYSTSNPFNPMYEPWLNRGRGDFLFSRYLVNQLEENLEGEALRTSAKDALRVNVNPFSRHHLDSLTHNYLDLSNDSGHLAWGFTCGEICKAGGYRKNPEIECQEGIGMIGGMLGTSGGMVVPSGSGNHRVISSDSSVGVITRVTTAIIDDQEFLDYHRMLLETAVNKLGNDIISDSYGNLEVPRSEMTARQKGLRETVVTIWNILKSSLNNGVYWESCDNAACRALRRVARVAFGRDPLELRRCEGLPRDIKVQLRHDDRVLCLSPEIVDDCQAKRSLGSRANFNTANCEPSYGERRTSGILGWRWGERRGYVLTSESAGSGDNRVDYVAAHETPRRSVDGWAPFATAMIAHQLVHDYYQKKLGRNRIEGWPGSHDALWEEETAVIAQSLVLTALQQEGYAPMDFSFQKEPIIPEVQTRSLTLPNGTTVQQVVGGTEGVRYFSRYEPRGFRGIYLGPQFASLRNISRVLYTERNPELARMMALIYSMAPILSPPAGTVRDGTIVEAPAPSATPPALPGGGGSGSETPPSGEDAPPPPASEPPPPPASEAAPPSADLSLNLSIGSSGAGPIVTVTIQNAGPDQAEGVLINLSCHPEGSCMIGPHDARLLAGCSANSDSSVLACRMPDLNVGETDEFTATLFSRGASSPRLERVDAMVGSSVRDPHLVNNARSTTVGESR